MNKLVTCTECGTENVRPVAGIEGVYECLEDDCGEFFEDDNFVYRPARRQRWDDDDE